MSSLPDLVCPLTFRYTRGPLVCFPSVSCNDGETLLSTYLVINYNFGSTLYNDSCYVIVSDFQIGVDKK